MLVFVFVLQPNIRSKRIRTKKKRNETNIRHSLVTTINTKYLDSNGEAECLVRAFDSDKDLGVSFNL